MADLQKLIIQKPELQSLEPKSDDFPVEEADANTTNGDVTQKETNCETNGNNHISNGDTSATIDSDVIPNDTKDILQSPQTSAAASPNTKRKSSVDSDKTVPSTKQKKSRKLQGVGVKKPLYTRYESLFIVKAYKTISERHPNLVLTDVFKIVAVLFKDEAQIQGFKARTPDQLYQKYKRIQHGLNHGEVEFQEFFKQNQYNPREWIPDFSNVQDISIIDRILFPKLDEAVNEVKWASNSSLVILKSENHDELTSSNTPNVKSESMDEAEAEVEVEEEEHDDELLNLAGFEDGHGDFKSLRLKIELLEERLRVQKEEIGILKEASSHKDQEIEFLKNMVKEDLSYIRHRLNDNKNV